jgi:phage terminase large subunit
LSQTSVEFPAKLRPLFQPSRYKVAWGGRGSAKSWSFARALLLQAAIKPLRILCAREVQRSIRDSVHRLLSDQIQNLELGSFFQVLETEIRGRNGSLFVFSGLCTHTVESIKSFEGVDIVWVEEAQTVSKRSWDILIPTIRKEASEIWISLNPELETDETAQRFIVKPPPGAFVVKVNYSDNPWFPSVLEQERLLCKERDPKGYPNIWEGEFKPAVEGAIYYDEMAEAARSGRIRDVPYDPTLPVHAVWDLGFNDAMSIIMVQRVVSEVRIIDYIEDTHRKLSDYVRELKERPYNWAKDWLPHDGYAEDMKGKSAAEILCSLGRSVPDKGDIVIAKTVEAGIKTAREVFPRVYFDRNKAARLIECLKRYKRNINQTTQEPGNPTHDEFSHGADAFRYLALNVDRMRNEEQTYAPMYEPRQRIIGSTGWMT